MVTSIGEIQITRRSTGTDPSIGYTLFEPAGAARGQTAVLLNGVAHQQQCWQQMAAYLAQHGLRSLSLDYRGIGMSQWSQPVQAVTLDHCVADLAAVLDAEQIDPHQMDLVGHSYGGGVAQRYAQQHEVGSLVLIGTLALGLWWKDVLRQMPYQLTHHPWLYGQLSKDPSILFATEQRAREYLFGQDAPAQMVEHYLDECWCPASGQALQQMLFAKPQPLHTRHILFLAGRQDHSVSPRLVRQSAKRLHAPFIELEGPHDVTLAGDWQGAANAILSFVQQSQEPLASQERNP